MPLSSEDVVNWQLKTGMRGYLVPQVDELLDEVADELDRLADRIAELEAEREAVRSSLEDQFEVEETLRRTLYQAQRAADQTIEDAKAEASRIIKEATSRSETIVSEARSEATEIYSRATREAKRERAEVRGKLQAEEARMRARRSELRTEIERLTELELETRRLLRGLYQDRLTELESRSIEVAAAADVPEADLADDLEDSPSLDADPEDLAADDGEGAPDEVGLDEVGLDEDDIDDGAGVEDQAFDDAAVALEASLDEAEVDEAQAGGASLDEDPSPVDADPQDVVASVVADPAPTAAGESSPSDVDRVRGPDGMPIVLVGSPDDRDADEEPAQGLGADSGDGRPRYLEAVDEAVAKIHENDAADAPGGDPATDDPATDDPATDDSDDDGSDLADDLVETGAERPTGSVGGMPRPDNLFDDAPRRRRRRSG